MAVPLGSAHAADVVQWVRGRQILYPQAGRRANAGSRRFSGTGYAVYCCGMRECMKARLVMSRTIVVLEGDQTGQELLEEALRVLDPGIIEIELAFQRFDLSL